MPSRKPKPSQRRLVRAAARADLKAERVESALRRQREKRAARRAEGEADAGPADTTETEVA